VYLYPKKTPVLASCLFCHAAVGTNAVHLINKTSGLSAGLHDGRERYLVYTSKDVAKQFLSSDWSRK